MELIPGAPAIIEGGFVGVLLLLLISFVYAILKGHLEPRATSIRVEESLEKRFQALKEAYDVSEEARAEALEIARESLDTSKTSLTVLKELRRESQRNE